MSGTGSEFSFHEMEEIKRRLETPEAPHPGPTIAPSGAPVPVGEVAPQEFFSRGTRSDTEALQLKRAIRVVQRHWVIIGFLTLALPFIMYLYDRGFNHPVFGGKIPHVLRATQVFAATVRVEVKDTPLPIGSNIMVELPVDKENVRKILETQEFVDTLEAQMVADAMNTGDAGTTAAPPVSPAKPVARSAYSLRAGAMVDNVVAVSVVGPQPAPLDRVATSVVAALNTYVSTLRQDRFTKTLKQYHDIQKENSRKLVEAWTRFEKIDAELRALSPDGIKDLAGFSSETSLLFNLRKEMQRMELELYKLENEIKLYKKKVNYDAIAGRLGILSDADIGKVMIEGNPLRMEWRNLEMELARLTARYTENHPRIIAIQDNIKAIKETLRKRGETTAAGSVAPLPKPLELEALRTVETLNSKITQTKMNLETVRQTLTTKADEEKRRQKKLEQEAADKPKVPQEKINEHKNAQQNLGYLQNKDREAAKKIIDLEMLKSQLNIEVDYAPRNKPQKAVLVKPHVPMDVSVAFIIGLLLGLGVAFLLESMDTHLHTPSDIYYHLRLNYLGVIPNWSDKDQVVIQPERPDSHIAEIYAHLCNNIRYGRGGNPEKRLLIASATQGEGKSTISANLSIRYALEGNSVVLIDADLRRPRGHKLLDIFQGGRTMQAGLADFLSGDHDFRDVVYGTSIPGLSLVPAGSRVRNAAKLLGAPTMLRMLDEAERNFDIVVVDCPAVLPVVDATILAPHMRGILMVIAAEQVEVGAVRMALYRLQHVGAPIAGAVLNKVRERSASYTYYGYRYRGGYYYSPYSSTYGKPEDDEDEEDSA